MTFLQAALNGDRQHPKVPRSPDDIARDARRVVEAGARSVHVHAFGQGGSETLEAEACADVLRAIRREGLNIPISLTTSAAIEPDAATRLTTVRSWIELPDLVTANQGEIGIVELSEYLMARDVGIEAGLLTSSDAQKFAQWPGRHRCVRVLIEPLDPEPEDAVRHADEMERIVHEAGVKLEQVHHGDGIASWAVNRRALLLGHGIRTGLEDTPVLPDGTIAANNAALIRAASEIIAAHHGLRE
jgi:uncharacterized protein (DUF849 family)